MSKKDFETFLNEKACVANPTDIDWNARKEEWLKSLNKFYDNVESWLKKYIDEGKIKIEKGKVTIREDHMGAYDADTRVLTIGDGLVLLHPIVTTLIGARGRVDIEGTKGTVKIILTNKYSKVWHPVITVGSTTLQLSEEWVWKIATPPPKVQFIELTSDTFFDALMEVA